MVQLRFTYVHSLVFIVICSGTERLLFLHTWSPMSLVWHCRLSSPSSVLRPISSMLLSQLMFLQVALRALSLHCEAHCLTLPQLTFRNLHLSLLSSKLCYFISALPLRNPFLQKRQAIFLILNVYVFGSHIKVESFNFGVKFVH